MAHGRHVLSPGRVLDVGFKRFLLLGAGAAYSFLWLLMTIAIGPSSPEVGYLELQGQGIPIQGLPYDCGPFLDPYYNTLPDI